MHNRQVKSFGSWSSPFRASLVAAQSIKLSELTLIGEYAFWLESRPEEQGKSILFRRDANGAIERVTPQPFNVRTRFYEYGGASYVVDGEDIYFSNYLDHKIFRQRLNASPIAITSNTRYRYADFVIDRKRDRLICLREDHSEIDGKDEVVSIVSISLTHGKKDNGRVLIEGNDFYSSPRLSPDGTKLAWLTWCLPNMPWDTSELWVADLTDEGTLFNRRLIGGGDSESILQPEWSPDGTLYYISDRSGWWNIYCWQHDKAVPLIKMSAEFGVPPWSLGTSNYAFESATKIVCAYKFKGITRLGIIDLESKRLDEVKTQCTLISFIRSSRGRTMFLGSSPTELTSLMEIDFKSGNLSLLRRSSHIETDSKYISKPKHIKFPTGNGLTAYGYFYSPKNPNYESTNGELPPLLMRVHGGPTACFEPVLKLEIQYWTSRGISVFDINYRGSSGYGRAYRTSLNGNWGIVDVDDCVNAARYLVKIGLVDETRLAITGGSSGGFTALSVLTFRDYFKAGSSHYGVSDLISLRNDTHRFESRYLEKLVGPYPQNVDIYKRRSPINTISKLTAPVIFFQGLEDRIVPPNQTEKIVAAMRQQQIPVAYITFEGEQHGFLIDKTIQRVLEAELYFYAQIFGFDLADSIVPIVIYNREDSVNDENLSKGAPHDR